MKMSSFGSEFEQIWPKAGDAIALTDFGRKLLNKCKTVEKPDKSQINIKEFILKSSNFPIEFGTNTCRVISQPKDRYAEIEKQISSAYPIIHERVLLLYLAFLEHKCEYGNKHEKEIFPNLTLTDFVQRLLTKRCASFIGKNDKHLLMSRERGCSGFMAIGTDDQKPPLLLCNVLSYDEIKLSALLSVSSHTEFLNDGNRQNCGKIEPNKSKIERAGVVIGIIGARLTRRDVMEFQDIIISKTQNTKENGYGMTANATIDTKAKAYRQMWKTFYDEQDFLYDNVQKDGKRFGDSKAETDIFDNVIMKKRYTMSFDTLLLDSEARAAAVNKQAYLHVVGIGLGVWKAAEQQEKIFLETFTQRLKVLLPKLAHISVVHFSWFQLSEWGELKNGGMFKSETHPDGGIKTVLSKRNPAAKLEPEHAEKLLVVSYAWDGNALPGNEFWMKMLKSTGDSSTACSTLITELHNPHINSNMVNGNNLHIASEKYGTKIERDLYKNLTLTDLVQRLLDKRCVSFLNAWDNYLLLTNESGNGNFESVGTETEKPPLTLSNVLSYDEIKLSAFLSVSSHSEFINDGNRFNAGKPATDSTRIVPEGIIIGLIGGRFERENVMEYQDVLITPLQNTIANGYGIGGHETNNFTDYRRLWSTFYEEPSILYADAQQTKSSRFYKVPHSANIFDNVMMKKRYAISFDTLLVEANARGSAANKLTYVHVVGIGLGVWKAVDHQTEIFLDTFAERLRFLLPQLQNIGVVHFSYFHVEKRGGLSNGSMFKDEAHPNGGITILISDRNPADKLLPEYEDMLVVQSYAWDANALPGNEFWQKSLTGSGDPAAACSTLISELHNPHINTAFVSGNNLHIATINKGVLHIQDYYTKVRVTSKIE